MPPVNFGDLDSETYGSMLFAPMESDTDNACFVKLERIIALPGENDEDIECNAVNAETGEFVWFEDDELIEIVDQETVHDHVIEE